jgi:tetratricopeptide (TPR) repeat protein
MRSSPILIGLAIAALLLGPSCRKKRVEVSDATYREVVPAFHTGLAALQTSQEVLARAKLDHVTSLAPDEAAGWANLGLLFLRQQELDAGLERLQKAAALAPKSGAIQRLLALAQGRKGDLAASIRHWRSALALDPGDAKAAFGLAQEIERQGGAANEAEAQGVLEALLERGENLAVRLEVARLSAKRGDGAALQKALLPLAEASNAWPEPAREQLAALKAAAGSPRGAAPLVAFLKNVLVREPEYRRAVAAVSTPRDEVGEPLLRFLNLDNPDPQPAPPDVALAFDVDALPGPHAGWVGAVSLSGEGAPAVLAADAKAVSRLGSAAATGAQQPLGGFPGGAGAEPPSPDGVLAADLDSDYHTDLVLAGAGGLRFLRQGEDGRFADVTAAAKLPPVLVGSPAHGAWAADFDTDGDLDVVLAPRNASPLVLRNNGDGTFAERRPFAGARAIRGFAWADLDGEGVPDAVLLEADGLVRVFLNQRGGVFREEALPAEVPRAVAVVASEASGDSLLDVLALGALGSVGRLTRKETTRAWEWAEVARVEPPAGLAPGRARLVLADLDNNGADDLLVAGTASTRVVLGGPKASPVALMSALPLAVQSVADLDGDGRLELLGRTAEGGLFRAKTRGAKAYHWQTLRPRAATATGDQRINSFGIGGEVEVRTGLHVQKKVVASPIVHFGLGEATQSSVVRITWPNGVLQSEFDKGADATLLTEQRLKGSCPWLFAWNGREMAFVTDILWRSPLGLRINAEASADVLMTEDRVKLRGDQLAPRDGFYDLRVTAELWETHFFDLVSLLVVDHEPGVELFVDERFAVPPPELGLVAMGPVREMQAVRDDQGFDVSDQVSARDNRHLDLARRGRYQGISGDHFVEMELPEDAPRRGPLWLVAQGWVHPTDSSVNVAIAQGAAAKPRSLALSVADEKGRFREVRQGLGFPAGKDKTILLDLGGVFPARGPRRARLSTNLEIYWDRLGWAEGRPDLRLAPRRQELATAELRPRGYSVTTQKDASSPERPRYVLAGTAPRWRDLEGYHTRFGDVLELLGVVDDRYVIMNAGDELVLRFPKAPPPAPGLVRDFVLVADGWEKDGDYNTTFSRTVLPLPTHASARYDRPPGALEDDPVYRRHPRDFDEYHTRYVTPERARDALRLRTSPDTP